MKKSDLKKGMVIEIRIGKKLLIINENNNDKPFFDLTYNIYHYLSLNDDLLNADNHECDVIKVYKDYTCSKILWERPQELLTQEEKDYLKAVLKPVKCKIDYICMSKNYIQISLDDTYDSITLPLLENITLKFEGLEINKKYTLKELGLE